MPRVGMEVEYRNKFTGYGLIIRACTADTRAYEVGQQMRDKVVDGFLFDRHIKMAETHD